jgi:hypothetical protein
MVAVNILFTVLIFIDGKWYAETWNTFGKVCEDMDEDYDLIEVKPRIKRKYWVNVYKSGQNFHPTKKDADAVAGNVSRPHCLHRTLYRLRRRGRIVMEDMIISMDEFGRFWVFNEHYEVFGGPYDTIEDAKIDYPEAEFEEEEGL